MLWECLRWLMNITPALFEAFLKCPTKCFLRSGGEVGTGNDYADWVRNENVAYREAGTKRLMEDIPPDECALPSPDPPNLKAAKWRLAVDLPARAQNLESRLHAVERVASEGQGKPAQFIPIRFLFTNKLTRDDKLLLAFDALVLSEMLGREVSIGKIIHGDDHATFKVKTAASAGEVRKLINGMTPLLSSSMAPDLILIRHCAECEFRDRCRSKATEKDDLSSCRSKATEKDDLSL